MDNVLLMNMVIAGVLMGVGDQLAQSLELYPLMKGKTMFSRSFLLQRDWQRTFRLCFTNGIVLAPLAMKWYALLDGLALPLLVSVLLDQLLWGAVTNSLFYFVTKYLEGESVMNSIVHVRRNVPLTIRAAFYLWPLVQIVNLSMVPLEYRLIVMNIVSVPWSAYLSLKSASAPTTASPGHIKQKGSESESSIEM